MSVVDFHIPIIQIECIFKLFVWTTMSVYCTRELKLFVNFLMSFVYFYIYFLRFKYRKQTFVSILSKKFTSHFPNIFVTPDVLYIGYAFHCFLKSFEVVTKFSLTQPLIFPKHIYKILHLIKTYKLYTYNNNIKL